MKNFSKLFLAIFFIFSIAIISCDKNEVNSPVVENDLKVDNNSYDELFLGSISICDLNGTRSTLKNLNEDVRKVTFYNTRNEEGLSIYLNKKDGFIECDVNKDFQPDFLLKEENNDLNKPVLTYYSIDKTPYKTVSITFLDKNKVSIDVVKLHTRTRAWFGGGTESWHDCFSKKMGSATGIIMTTLASFVGPEGTAAVVAAGALSCVIYNPN